MCKVGSRSYDVVEQASETVPSAEEVPSENVYKVANETKSCAGRASEQVHSDGGKLRSILVDEEISDRVPTDGEQQGSYAVKGSTSDRVAVTVSRAERIMVYEQACDRVQSEL